MKRGPAACSRGTHGHGAQADEALVLVVEDRGARPAGQHPVEEPGPEALARRMPDRRAVVLGPRRLA